MLAVVGFQSTGQTQIASAAAQMAAGFKNCGVMAAERELYRGGHAGPAATDDGNLHGRDYMRPSACIFQTSQSLRSGVRLMRWCST